MRIDEQQSKGEMVLRQESVRSVIYSSDPTNSYTFQTDLRKLKEKNKCWESKLLTNPRYFRNTFTYFNNKVS